MTHLNWKDTSDGGSRAYALDVGYYWITEEGGYELALGEITETYYEVEYGRFFPHRETPTWQEIDYPSDFPRTLAEAKRIAEEDCEQRRRDLLSDDERVERIHKQ